MYKIVIASGKGGVGKSMVAANLAIYLSSRKKISAVDCDVDAPNLATWLGDPANWDKRYKISVSKKAFVDFNKCNGCNKCVENCLFEAVSLKNKKAIIDKFSCEGCGVCKIVCPQNAVTLKSVLNGEVMIKKTKYGFPLTTGHLFPGETGSGKIVSEIKEKAGEADADIMIIDSSPGTGCPVIASLQDSDFALMVTEPTPSGLSDLNRVLKLVKHFRIPFRIIINKWDINSIFSQRISRKFKGKIIGKISYNQDIFRAVSNFKPILTSNLLQKVELETIFKRILKLNI